MNKELMLEQAEKQLEREQKGKLITTIDYIKRKIYTAMLNGEKSITIEIHKNTLYCSFVDIVRQERYMPVLDDQFKMMLETTNITGIRDTEQSTELMNCLSGAGFRIGRSLKYNITKGFFRKTNLQTHLEMRVYW